MTNPTHRGSTETLEHSLALKVALDDALEGYEKMLEKADASFKPTVSELIAVHLAARQDIDALLRQRGAAVDPDGSFMGAVHKTVVTLRSVVDDPDSDWIPGILDGEKRNLRKYDAAITEATTESALQASLQRHRGTLHQWIDTLDARRPSQRKVG